MASPTSPYNPTTSEEAPTHETSHMPISDLDYRPKFWYSSTKLARLRDPWKFCLIAKVLGKKVQLQYYRNHLLRLWSPEGSLDIIELGYEYFLLKFSEFLDFEKVRKGVPWLIHGYYIALRPWSPNFKPSEATITHTWVWVRLPELPIEYYDREVLFEIGAAIGRTIKIDPITERKEKGKFARICVEVDLSRPLIAHVDLAGLLQKIEYEGHVRQLQQHASPHPPQAPSHRTNSGAWLGSRARGLEQVNPMFPAPVLKPSKGKSAITSVSITSPCIEMNLGSNKLLGKKRHLQPEEGTSSSVMNMETIIPAEDVPLAVEKLPSPMEAPTAHLPPCLEPKVSSKLSAKCAKLPQDSFQQPHKPQAYPLPPSPAESYSNIVASPVTSDPRPTQGLVVSPPQEASCFPTFSTAVNASPNLDLPQLQPSPMPSFNFHSLKIKDFSEPKDAERKTGEEMELSPENHPNGFSIQRTPRVFRTEPNTPNFEIKVNLSRTAHQHKIRFIRPVTSSTMHHTWKAIPASHPKKLLVWNQAEAGNLNFMPAMKELIQMHKPSIILLLEPRISGAVANEVKDIGFSGSRLFAPDGLSHGIWILWKGEDVHVEVSSSTSAQFQVAVEVISKAHNRMLYGDTPAQPWGEGGYFCYPDEQHYSSSSQSEIALSEDEVQHRIPAPLLDLLFRRPGIGEPCSSPPE